MAAERENEDIIDHFPAPQDKGNVGFGDEIEWQPVVVQKFFLSSFEAFR